MERCATHGFLNCKCEEKLSAYLARQFRESGSDHVDRGQLGQSSGLVGDMGNRVLRRGTMGREAKR